MGGRTSLSASIARQERVAARYRLTPAIQTLLELLDEPLPLPAEVGR